MSDSNSKYTKGRETENQINSILESLSPEDCKEVLKGITVDIDFVNRYFKSHFENLPEDAPESKSALSKIMTNAWYYFKKSIYVSFSECLKAAWKAYRVTIALMKGETVFTYRKSTGELREAIGTLSNDRYQFNNKGVRVEAKPDVIKYFDITADGWRSFRIERLISIAA